MAEFHSIWERLDDWTERLHVPGGWLVRTCLFTQTGNVTCHQVFVEDPEHDWRPPLAVPPKKREN